MTTWLQKATSKNKPKFAVIHGNAATNGERIHRDNSLPANYEEIDFNIYIPAKPRNRATISRADLTNAAKQALALRPWNDRAYKPAIRFSMNGAFTYSAETNGTGRISGEIVDGYNFVEKFPNYNGKGGKSHRMTYQHHGETPSEFALNPQYLLDALSGMEGETVELDAPNRTAPVYITDGTHEAVIMPVNLR